jgi:hypothetical protein
LSDARDRHVPSGPLDPTAAAIAAGLAMRRISEFVERLGRQPLSRK